MRVRVFYKENGTVTVRRLGTKSRRVDETVTEWEERLFNKKMPENIGYEDMDDTELPFDKIDRAFWTGREDQPGVMVDATQKAEHIEAVERKRLIKERTERISEDQLVDEGLITRRPARGNS